MITISHVTQAQAATVINAVFIITQYTFGLAVVVVSVYFMYNTNSAIAWSGVTRTLHSSLWPTLLCTDSTSSGDTWSRISIISNLSILGGILVAVAGVVTPLGLDEGPPMRTNYVSMGASYVPDASPIGRATSPRDKFTYGRLCGLFIRIPCPGNGLNGNTSQISPDIFKTFTSTPYGPFNMQFRRYYQGVGDYIYPSNYPMMTAQQGIVESLILRNDLFSIEGLIVDMTRKPGIGLWNHTLPPLKRGGVWSEDVLWLEPVSACVNTNLTIDYRQLHNDAGSDVQAYNLTDRGGFVNLTHDYPLSSQNGQNINLYEHAYKGAVLSNFYTMRSFNNMTQNESYIGKALSSHSVWPAVGKMQSMTLATFLNPNVTREMDPTLYNATDGVAVSCMGYGAKDIANATNVSVHCSLMLGPPYRVDGGDPRLPGDNTTWTQTLHVCAATTRARMQRVEFSFNGNLTLDNLRISRQDTNTSVLWAIEKTNLTIGNVDIFWGRVADSYEDSPSLSTTRSEIFYLPAIIVDGHPSTLPASLWGRTFNDLSDYIPDGPVDYSGSTNYALLAKWQSLIEADPENNPSQILNMIWTDIAANNLVGTDTATTLMVAPYVPSITYDSRYGIPALLLMFIWLPLFLIATFILLRGRLRLSHLRHLLNQTSMGRVVVGDSAIRASTFDLDEDPVGNRLLQSGTRHETGFTATSHLGTKDWTKAVGQTPVAFYPVDSTSRDSPESGTEGAEGELIIPTTKNGDLSRGKALTTALQEHLQSGHSRTTPCPSLPDAKNPCRSQIYFPSQASLSFVSSSRTRLDLHEA
jgi:hypothetical protein